jgi:5-(carboxyamino)imidazole ribonucleotide synthase
VHKARDVEWAYANTGNGPFLLERLVPFDRELSIIAVRNRAGEARFYPLVENRHERGILRQSLAPAPGLTADLQAEAEGYAQRIMEALDYVGVMAVEFFQLDGKLLANEMAPRVHNSGHWTIEGAATSQFENHLRAILDWPLGSTAVHEQMTMINLIGRIPPLEQLLAIPGAHVHLYGKSPAQGRKLGHVTICGIKDPSDFDLRVGY